MAMGSVTRVERAGIEECVKKINGAIESLMDAAKVIDSSMNEIGSHWEGASATQAMETYQSEYQQLLTTTVPEAVSNFRDYINQCMEKIIEIDEQLAGH